MFLNSPLGEVTIKYVCMYVHQYLSCVQFSGSVEMKVSQAYNYNPGQKSWDTLHFWDVFQFTQVQPLPSPRKQCWTSASWIFSDFQLCIGWGEGELQENFEKGALFYEGTEKWQKIMNNALLSQGLLSMIEPVEKLATPPEVKMATFSCVTFAGNRERAEWAHIACWGSQSELSVPFILPSRGFSYVKISVDWNILCDRTSEFFIRSKTKFRLLLEIFACRNCLLSVSWDLY